MWEGSADMDDGFAFEDQSGDPVVLKGRVEALLRRVVDLERENAAQRDRINSLEHHVDALEEELSEGLPPP